MPRNYLCLLFVIFVAVINVHGSNPYTILGISRSATQSEIKRAYREKARETHPDRNPGNKKATERAFIEIADAYELLSDEERKQQFDRYGSKKSRTQQPRYHSRHFKYAHHWQQQRWKQRRINPRHQRARNRVIFIRTVSHLRNVALDDDGSGLVDKHFLLALFGSAKCEKRLDSTLIYPFPFAHMSDEHGIWWEDVLQTAKTPLFDPFGGLSKIAKKYAVLKEGCPTFLFWRKGDRLNNPKKKSGLRSADDFTGWMWEHLKVMATFRNEHSHDVKLYWFSGAKSKQEWIIKSGEELRSDVYLSHIFVARDTRVEGTILSKETSLLWYHIRGTSEDGTTELIRIVSKCHDLHGNCKDWARKGECNKNPGYMLTICKLSCKSCSSSPVAPRHEL